MNAHETFLLSRDSHSGKPEDKERHRATFLQFAWAELACPPAEGETEQDTESRRVAFMKEHGLWFRESIINAVDENGLLKYRNLFTLFETDPQAAAQKVHELYREERTIH